MIVEVYHINGKYYRRENGTTVEITYDEWIKYFTD